jgi:uncharacterized protein (TIGR03437 family)
VAGASLRLTVGVQTPPATPLTISLQTENGLFSGPGSVVIPAGERSATVNLRAEREGVEVLTAQAAGYGATEVRVRVAGSVGQLQLRVISGDRQTAVPGQMLPQPVVVKLTDENDLPYAGFRILSQGGLVSPASQITDENGRVSFQWTPSAGPANLVRFTVEGSAAPTVQAIALSKPAIVQNSIVNAASFQPGLTPGGIATLFGFNLGSARVAINGIETSVFFTNDSQINFVAPATLSGATATVVTRTSLGESDPVTVPVLRLQPGVFFDAASGRAAAIAHGQRIFEIYGTGFGPVSNGVTDNAVTATAGGQPAEVLFSGLAPGFIGLYQINIRVDTLVPAGEQDLNLSSGGQTSNTTKLPIAP